MVDMVLMKKFEKVNKSISEYMERIFEIADKEFSTAGDAYIPCMAQFALNLNKATVVFCFDKINQYSAEANKKYSDSREKMTKDAVDKGSS